MKYEELRATLYHIIDALWVCENVERLPNCNNCGKKNVCSYCVKAGEMVRINCFEWESENKNDDDT